jgi:hypothetical protein
MVYSAHRGLEGSQAVSYRPWLGWLPLVALPTATFFFYRLLPPWEFMWLLAFAIFAGFKWLTWWRARWHIKHAGWRSVVYLTAWPGMDAGAFLDTRRTVPKP